MNIQDNLTILSPCNMLEAIAIEQDSGCKVVQLPYSNVQGITPQEAFTCRNDGVDAATTEWVTFVDPLDAYNWPAHLALLNTLVESPMTTMVLIPPKGTSLINIPETLLIGGAMPTGCITIRKNQFQAIGGFSSTIPHSASWEFLVRYFTRPETVDSIVIAETANTWMDNTSPNSIANTMLPPHQEVIEWRKQWLSLSAS